MRSQFWVKEPKDPIDKAIHVFATTLHSHDLLWIASAFRISTRNSNSYFHRWHHNEVVAIYLEVGGNWAHFSWSEEKAEGLTPAPNAEHSFFERRESPFLLSVRPSVSHVFKGISTMRPNMRADKTETIFTIKSNLQHIKWFVQRYGHGDTWQIDSNIFTQQTPQW